MGSESGQIIVVDFTHFDLEYGSSDCPYDFVRVSKYLAPVLCKVLSEARLLLKVSRTR